MAGMKYFGKGWALPLAAMALAAPLVRAQTEPAAPPPSAQAAVLPKAVLGRKALSALTSALSDSDAEVRAAAAAAFGELGNPAAAGLLKKGLKDRSASVRIETAYALHRLGEGDAVALIGAIIDKLAAPADGATGADEMRLMARTKSRILGVERLADIGGERVVDIFERLLKDESGAVRDATGIALARMGLDEFAAPFVDAARSEDEMTRAAAIEALGRIAAPAHLGIIQDAAADASVPVRAAAMRALSRFSTADSARTLTAGVKDKDARVRSQALAALAKLTERDSSPLLRETLKANAALESQLKCLAGLARRGDRIELGVVEAGLLQKDFDLRLLAVDALAAAETDASSALLARVIDQDADRRVRVRAASVLVRRLGKGSGA